MLSNKEDFKEWNKETDKVDNVNHPHHYEGSTSLECIECMTLLFGESAVISFCLCNAFKYMWRYKNKNGVEDLKKAKWYLDYAYNYPITKSAEQAKLIDRLITLQKYLTEK